MRKNAIAKLRGQSMSPAVYGRTYMSQGTVRTHTDGRMRNRVYHTIEATKKIAPMMYRSTAVCVLLPVSKVSWKEV